MSISSKRPGSNLLAAELNAFQDDYDATIFRSWKPLGSAIIELTDASTAATRYARPGMQGSSTTASAATSFHASWTGMLDTGVAARGSEARMVLDVVRNDLCPSNLITSAHFKEVTAFSPLTFASPIVAIANPVLSPGRSVHSSIGSFGGSGLHTISLTHASVPANGYAIVQILLQHRQVA